MGLKLVIFELDDVLIDEEHYIRSSLLHLTDMLASRYQWEAEDVERQLLASMQISRENIIERVLAQKGVLTPSLLSECRESIEQHLPAIRLSNRIKRQLKSLARKYQLFVVTIGSLSIQANKIRVLGLDKSSYIQDIQFIDHQAPEPTGELVSCIRSIAEAEQCSVADMVYLTANQHLDYATLAEKGLKIIQLANTSISSAEQLENSGFRGAEVDIVALLATYIGED